MMKSIKKINNNVVLADDNGQEVIALGRGIGFNAQSGAQVDDELVEKIFILQKNFPINLFQEILAGLPYEHIILASKIVDFGKSELKTKLNQSIIVALADHLSFAIERLQGRIEIKMPLVQVVQQYYKDEYAVGIAAVQLLKKEIGLSFPASEAVAIALHFINAETEKADITATMADLTQKTEDGNLQ